MREKYKSQTIKKGEPDDHILAVELGVAFINKHRQTNTIRAIKDYYIRYPEKFIQKMKFKDGEFKEHVVDSVILEELDNGTEQPRLFIEWQGNLDYKTKYQGKPLHVTRTKHSKKSQQKNDGIFQNYRDLYHPQANIIRPLKEELFGTVDNEEDRELYLTRILWKSIK